MENIQVTENKTMIQIVKGVGIAFLTTVVLLLIFSIVLTYTNLQETTISPVIIVITAISILIGSSIATSKIRKNGLANGGVIGGIYILSIYLISSILNGNFGLHLQSIILIVVGVAFGLLGGIIGVNRK